MLRGEGQGGQQDRGVGPRGDRGEAHQVRSGRATRPRGIGAAAGQEGAKQERERRGEPVRHGPPLRQHGSGGTEEYGRRWPESARGLDSARGRSSLPVLFPRSLR
jgi:hypothetical protein